MSTCFWCLVGALGVIALLISIIRKKDKTIYSLDQQNIQLRKAININAEAKLILSCQHIDIEFIQAPHNAYFHGEVVTWTDEVYTAMTRIGDDDIVTDKRDELIRKLANKIKIAE